MELKVIYADIETNIEIKPMIINAKEIIENGGITNEYRNRGNKEICKREGR